MRKLALALLLLSGVAQAQPFKTGDTVTNRFAVCETMEDAATLIALTTRYGQNTGIGYMQEDDNTCVLTPVTITVGEIELGDMNDKKGLEWVILNVTVDDKPLYVVIPSVALVKPTSY